MNETITFANLADFAGLEFGPTPWFVLDQARIDAFAACTGDDQYIHVDPVRAAREGPYGNTIAHGFLLLSLLAKHAPVDWQNIGGVRMALNYGFDRIRFITPVVAGSNIRLRSKLIEAMEKGAGRVLLKLEHTMEIERSATPALAAEHLVMLVAGP
jgi:acyl dehydratase